MERKEVTRAEVIPMLIELFGLTEEKTDKGFVVRKGDNASFYVNKAYMWRNDVINTLITFFNKGEKEIFITDGQCRIENITLVWTTFHIEEVNAHKR